MKAKTLLRYTMALLSRRGRNKGLATKMEGTDHRHNLESYIDRFDLHLLDLGTKSGLVDSCRGFLLCSVLASHVYRVLGGCVMMSLFCQPTLKPIFATPHRPQSSHKPCPGATPHPGKPGHESVTITHEHSNEARQTACNTSPVHKSSRAGQTRVPLALHVQMPLSHRSDVTGTVDVPQVAF